MNAGKLHFLKSQMSPAQVRAHEQVRDGEGRFARVSDQAKVQDVASFKSGAADLVRAAGALSVGELRQLFDGKSVTQIVKLGVAGRAAVMSAGIGFDSDKNQASVGAQRGAAAGFSLASAYAVGGDPTVQYNDPGIPAFLAEAQGLIDQAKKSVRGGQAQNAARPIAEAIALYDVILESSPHNPDALVGKAIALRTGALSSVDIRAEHNESNNVRRHAREQIKDSNTLIEQVIARGAETGIYDAVHNRITLPNLNKFIGNDELRNGVSMVAEALYQRGLGQVALARIEGRDPFSKEILKAFDRATHVGTDLSDPAKAQQLFTTSAWNGNDPITKAHNAKLQGTLSSVAEFARGIGAQHQVRYSNEVELAAIGAHSKSGLPFLSPDLRRAPGLQNAIA
ncbi:MAG: hypothetical protein IPG45_25045 [Deltaproteobacteria bacterium]|nr:hypothetical protein [Deltaproteobacteria bacterium]